MFVEVQHWSGAGNRFVIIDNRKKIFDEQLKTFVPNLCQRKTLPPAEGLLVLLDIDADKSSCVYDFYNPDGSTGVMCGNGARCAVKYAVELDKFDRNLIQLVLNNRVYTAKILENDHVALSLPLYKELRLFDTWTYVNVGSHHVVLDARDFLGSIDEFHRFDLVKFAEEKLDFYREQVGISYLNLNFAYPIENQSTVHLRTYENGVFYETQACGTGAVSTAITFYTRNVISNSKIELIPTSQRPLVVHLQIGNENSNILGMILEGDARQDASASQFDTITRQYQ